jgi:hypothetical protein
MDFLFDARPEGPAVLLGSGPGPGPALDAGPDELVVNAMLQQVDHETGLRGWMLHVHQGERPGLWPRHHFSRGVRPPMIQAREDALRALGYEPVPGQRWRWQESTTLDQKNVLMFAGIAVRAVQETAAGAASDDLVQRCQGCGGRGARILPSASAETECSDCEGTGRAVLAPSCMTCHDRGCADCGRAVPAPSSAPSREYGAPALPLLGPVDSGAPEMAERP